MTISLTPAQHAWIAAHVERGEFPSVEEAVRELIDECIAGHELAASDDLAWAKPLVDAGLAEIDRGEVITLAEHEARMTALLDDLKPR